ncbi:hypothetical protein VTN77DRAFT_5878 [Rasamsonia byssochlamydoides]|uniref:uncharacterized protein n=1 Tax=Rasamsonia byssochlamydoides TaxID=89139 RepID=UPI00374404E1
MLWRCMLHPAGGTSLQRSIGFFFLKLDVSVALASDTAVRVPLPISFPFNLSELHHTDIYRRVFHYAHLPLLLCANALLWCNDDSSPHRPIDSWMQLVDELERWYRMRPQEFQPMLELDSRDRMIDGNFPVILFTNGAGIFGNQLYHTAMLLLLLNKPRTARVDDSHSRPSVISPLWHAQRICSIALHNDRRECWDLCLLASFLVAARRMRHESQQQEILHGFARIKSLTGWDVGELLNDLRQEWCIREGA